MSWKSFFHIDMRNPFMQIFVGVGLLQGILYYFIIDKSILDASLETIHYTGWRQVTAWFLFQAGFTFFLTYQPRQVLRSAVVSSLFGLLQVGLWLMFFSVYDAADKIILPTEYAISMVLCYVAMPFLQIYVATGRLVFSYEDLFQHSWNNIQITTTSYILTVLFFGVLFLCCGLLKVLKFELFWSIITSKGFFLPACFTVKAIGYAMARENDSIVAALRKTLLAFCRFLSPILGLFAVLFLMALAVGGLEAVWETKMATPLFVGFILLTILFFNAVFQDGAQDIYFNGLIGTVQRAGLVLLPFFAGLAVYSLMQRIDQYGLTPPRFYGILITFIAGLFALIYALAALVPGRAAQLITQGNVGMAFLILAICALIQVPMFSPATLSASHQKHLLVSGRITPEKFDFPALQWNMGKPGRQVLADLEAAESPNASLVREKIQQAKTSNRFGRPERPKTSESELRNLSSYMIVKFGNDAVPDQLLNTIHKLHGVILETCRRYQKCALIRADINRDGKDEALLINGQIGSVNVYLPTPEGEWTAATFHGRLALPGKPTEMPLRKLKGLKDLESYLSVVKPVTPPAIDDLELGQGATIFFNR